ncbi:hypothetical protein LTR36_009816 [Oleoguttula mirabilis]|uniref:Uncharacterized protein n=1 Tax=Oleoguttula mirabilis TaxID=1507867 RepID=A0AAV9J513_9PEZI|nr:hypothetical protein LTR36_009816 [Oleoguttula mirabilis]
MASADFSEYDEVIRVNPSQDYEILKRDGYAFISEQKPLAARQYCRDMTLARGRILYQVWDQWTAQTLGYIVPEEILSEAKAYRPGSALNPWPEEPAHTRNLLQHVYERLTIQFERIPHTAAKSVAEEIHHALRRRPMTKRAIEDAVVEHVRLRWTSYEFRVKNMVPSLQRECEVVEMIKPRMREVLRSWLPQYISGEALVELWERHGLLDADADTNGVVEIGGEVAGGETFEDVAFRRPALFYHGGLETPANLVTVLSARL